VAGDVNDVIVVEIETRNSTAAPRPGWLVLDGDRALVRIELDHPKALGVLNAVAKNRSTLLSCGRFTQHGRKPLAVEDVVAKDEADIVLADKLLADAKRLREPGRACLDGIFELDPEAGTVAQHVSVGRLVSGSSDDKDVPDASEHQHRQGVVDHRLVIDRQQLLGHPESDRI